MNIVKLLGPACIIPILSIGLLGCSSDQVDETPRKAKTPEVTSAPLKQLTVEPAAASVDQKPYEVKKRAYIISL